MSDSFDTWLKEGRCLPDLMSNFHDQKDLFKAVDEVAERSIAKGNDDIKDVSWRAAHIYTVDIFLWTMAKHGYTLQNTRKPFAFGDIRAFVTDCANRMQEHSVSLIKSMFPKSF